MRKAAPRFQEASETSCLADILALCSVTNLSKLSDNILRQLFVARFEAASQAPLCEGTTKSESKVRMARVLAREDVNRALMTVFFGRSWWIIDRASLQHFESRVRNAILKIRTFE